MFALLFFDKPSWPLFASICRVMLTVLSRHKNVCCSNLQFSDQVLCCLFDSVQFGTQEAIIQLMFSQRLSQSAPQKKVSQNSY
jgi:hypothetical protein